MRSRHRLAAVVVVGSALLTGCGGGSGGAGPAQPSGPPSASAPDPASYRYVLTSSCGERGFLGDYRVVVREGRVVSARSLDEHYPYRPDLSEVPTLADLRHMAATAAPGTVVGYELDAAGRVRSLSLDPVPNGIDDEECYEVSRLQVLATSTGGGGPVD